MWQRIRNLFLGARFYYAMAAIIFSYVAAYFFPTFGLVAELLTSGLIVVVLADAFLLFWPDGETIQAQRDTPDRLSNGDRNRITLYIENRYRIPIRATAIDEVPHQFQIRDFIYQMEIGARKQGQFSYFLRPTRRGEYHFMHTNIFAETIFGVLRRRFRIDNSVMVPVYPSYIQMRQYELMAISNRLTEAGIKKIRRVGHTMEFDQIREYVRGDDYRTVNWKATARRRELMVNHYQDEKAQQVYSVINMGRVMKMPFEEMSLLDYAINASLVISNIAVLKQDKAGIITFSNTVHSILMADRRPTQIAKVLELLYRQKTSFLEADYQRLYTSLMNRLNQRSLVLLYTNFESLYSLKNQMRYLRGIARKHLLVVIFFENTELQTLQEMHPGKTEDIYIKTIAEQFAYEKRQIVKELQKYGIFSILTTPQALSVNTINKYLQLKARGFI